MITLLNGETYNKDEIITLAHDDEFYYGHLGQHALSSSSLKTLLKIWFYRYTCTYTRKVTSLDGIRTTQDSKVKCSRGHH